MRTSLGSGDKNKQKARITRGEEGGTWGNHVRWLPYGKLAPFMFYCARFGISKTYKKGLIYNEVSLKKSENITISYAIGANNRWIFKRQAWIQICGLTLHNRSLLFLKGTGRSSEELSACNKQRWNIHLNYLNSKGRLKCHCIRKPSTINQTGITSIELER